MPLRFTAFTVHRPEFFPKKLQWFSAMVTLFRFGESLLIVAGPVALYRWNHLIPGISTLPLNDFQKGILAVLAFYLLSRCIFLIMLQPFSQVLPKMGVNNSLGIGLILHMLCYLGFSLLPQYPVLYYILPVLRALSLMMYWIGYHLFFSTEADLKKLGRELGALEFISRLATLMGPVFGALLASSTNFSLVFLTSSVFYTLAAVCAFSLPRHTSHEKWSWSEYFSFLRHQAESKRLTLSVAGLTWETIGIGVFWPLFLALELNSIRTAAYILSAASLSALLLTYFSGWIFDHRKRSAVIARCTGMALSLLWLPRFFFSQTPMALVMTDSADRVLGGMYGAFFEAGFIWQARHRSVFEAYFHYEATVTLTLIGGYTFALIALLIFQRWDLLFLSFLLAGILSLVFRFSKVLPQEKV